MLVLHLHFDGGGEHLVKHPRSRTVDQNTAITGFAGEAVFDHQSVVGVAGIRGQVSERLTQAHQIAIPNDETGLDLGIFIRFGHIGRPIGC